MKNFNPKSWSNIPEENEDFLRKEGIGVYGRKVGYHILDILHEIFSRSYNLHFGQQIINLKKQKHDALNHFLIFAKKNFQMLFSLRKRAFYLLNLNS